MAAANYDLYIEQGATFTLRLIWKDSEDIPIDLTGTTARMQIRKGYDTEVVIGLTSGVNGGIVLGGLNGIIDIIITDEQTTGIEIKRGKYDLELENSGTVTRLIEGGVEIVREVTKDA